MRQWMLSLVVLTLFACGGAEDNAFTDAEIPDSAVDLGLDAAVDAELEGPDAELDAELDAADAMIPDVGPQPRDPPPVPEYAGGQCPPLISGATGDTSLNEDFLTAGVGRNFRLMVPSDYDPAHSYPLVFAWHWLAGTSEKFVKEGEIESAIDQWQFIVVLFDRRLKNGRSRYPFAWPIADVLDPEGAKEDEIQFFNDVFACVTEQFNVDLRRVYGLGVSAGALWLTRLLSTPTVDHFAAVEVISGGMGRLNDAWRIGFTPRAHRFPAFILWGGERDRLGVNFNDASILLRDTLLSFGHFVATCTHDQGHALPPIEPPEGQTKFRMLWRFFTDHPYGLDPGDSPYLQDGLPEEFESWCTIPDPQRP